LPCFSGTRYSYTDRPEIMTNQCVAENIRQRSRGIVVFIVVTIVAVLGLSTSTLSQVKSGDGPGPAELTQDNRIPVTLHMAPWWSLVGVRNSLGPICTGTIIGTSRVLTAAHCLKNPATGKLVSPALLGLSMTQPDRPISKYIEITGYRTPSGCTGSSKRKTVTHATDWAIIETQHEFDNNRVLPVLYSGPGTEFTSFSSDLLFASVSFYSRRMDTMGVHYRCQVSTTAPSKNLVAHNCDTGFAGSGTPILLRRNGKFEIFAIQVGRQTTGTGLNFAVRIPPLPLKDIFSWAQGMSNLSRC
jgi:protease YdgD